MIELFGQRYGRWDARGDCSRVLGSRGQQSYSPAFLIIFSGREALARMKWRSTTQLFVRGVGVCQLPVRVKLRLALDLKPELLKTDGATTGSHRADLQHCGVSGCLSAAYHNEVREGCRSYSRGMTSAE